MKLKKLSSIFSQSRRLPRFAHKKTERGQLAPRCRFCDLFRLNDPDRDRAIGPCPSMTIRQVLHRIAAFNPKYHRILRLELPQFLKKPHLAIKFEKTRKI